MRRWIQCLKDAICKPPRSAEETKPAPKKADEHPEILRAIEDIVDRAFIKYDAYEKQQRRANRNNRAIAVAAVLVAFAYTTFAALQWDEMRKSVELSRTALDANERAWLIGGPAKMEVRQDGVLIITTTFNNASKCPAFFVRHNVGITGVHVAPEDGDALTKGSVLSVGPGNAPGSKVTNVTPRPDVTTDQIKLIMSGRAPFFVWLRIKYSDPFSGDPTKRTRDTLECWSYDARQSALVICSGGQYHR